MSISLGASVAGAKVLDVAYASRSEKQADSTMAAQNSATETQSEGLRERPTALDRLCEQPSPLDRFAD